MDKTAERIFDAIMQIISAISERTENDWDDYLVPALKTLKDKILGIFADTGEGDGLPAELSAMVGSVADECRAAGE